jgi:hypothetical protein
MLSSQSSCLFEMPFSELINDCSSLYSFIESESARCLSTAAKLVGVSLTNMSNLKGSVRLIYSEGTLEGLRTGKYVFPVNATTKLKSAVPTDRLGRIVEHPKIEHVHSLVNFALLGAALLASIENQRRLAAIEYKLDRVIEMLESDRDGRVRGAYESLARAMSLSDTERYTRALEIALQNLDQVAGSFHEQLIAQIKNIRTPDTKGYIADLFAWPPYERRKLDRELTSAVNNYKKLRFCFFLKQVAAFALNQPAELRVLILHQTAALDEIKSTNFIRSIHFTNPKVAAEFSGELDKTIQCYRNEISEIEYVTKLSAGSILN